jgi:hypothetical protein
MQARAAKQVLFLLKKIPLQASTCSSFSRQTTQFACHI